MPVQLALLEELRERELVHRLRPLVDGLLGRDDPVGERRRRDQPARAAGRAPASCSPTRRTRRVQGARPCSAPDGLPVVAELGVVVVLDDDRRRCAAPTSSSAARRSGGSTAPTGYWCAAVTSTPWTARVGRAGRRACPSSSTGIDTTFRPARATISRYSGANGSSTANRRAPPAASADASSPRPCANPEQTTTSAGSAAVPRTRLRYAASATRSSGTPWPAEVGQPRARRRLERPAQRPQPGPARELGRRRAGRAGSRTRTTPARGPGPRARRREPGGHPRRAARPAHEVALGDELLVRLDDHAPRDARAAPRARATTAPPPPPRAAPYADRVPQPRSRAAGGAAPATCGPRGSSSSGAELVLELAIELDLTRGPLVGEDASNDTTARRDRRPEMDALLILFAIIADRWPCSASSPSTFGVGHARRLRPRRHVPRADRRAGGSRDRPRPGPTSRPPSPTSPPGAGRSSSARGRGVGAPRHGPGRPPAADPPDVRGDRRGPPAHRRARRAPPRRATSPADGRYALHAHQDPGKPDEFQVRGRARVVERRRLPRPGRRRTGTSRWPTEDLVVELGIEHALLGERPDADAWPPVYRSWHAAPRGLTLLEHHDLARRLPGPQAVEGVLEVVERQVPVDEPVDGQLARPGTPPRSAGSRPPRRPTRSWTRGSAARRRRTGTPRTPPTSPNRVSPTSTAVPPGGSAAIACAIGRREPDRLEHEVRPAVARRLPDPVDHGRAGRAGSAWTQCVAPSSPASSSLAGLTSTTTIRRAPASTAPITHDSPTPPSPITATVDPAGTAAVLSTAPTPVETPQPMSAATSGGTPSGIGTTAVAGTTCAFANVPIER